MIKIYGIQIDHLPNRHELRPRINATLYDSWRLRHRNIRDERMTRASLGGIFLLQYAGFTDPFAYESNGRPHFLNSAIDFNITHTDQHVFCAIELPDANQSDQPCRVGLDAEEFTHLRSLCICPLADRWFTRAEHEHFLRSPNDETFLQRWTRKEALLKWLGLGLRAMRQADTINAPEEHGVLFREYRVGGSIVVLCHRKESTPPDEVHLITDEAAGFVS